MSTYRSYICLILFNCLLQGCAEEKAYREEHLKEWPVVAGRTNPTGTVYNDVSPRYGYILTKMNDTLKGRLKILPFYSGAFRSILWLPSGKYGSSEIRSVDRSEIRYVRAFPDSVYTDNNYMDFVNLQDRELWRILATMDSLSVYDDFFPGMSNPFGYEMILVGKGNKWTRIYYHHYHGPGETISPDILKFINKRYKTDRQLADFSDEWAMIHYILDREAAASQ